MKLFSEKARYAYLFVSLLLTTARGAAQELPFVRDVTPPGITRVFQSKSSNTASLPETEKFTNLSLQRDGSLRGDGKSFELYGVTFPPRGKICGQLNEGRWACGLGAHGMARQAMAQKLVECERMQTSTDSRSLPRVTCWIEGKNFALMLLEQGLVFLAEDGRNMKAFLAADALAKSHRVGLWADAPIGFSHNGRKFSNRGQMFGGAR